MLQESAALSTAVAPIPSATAANCRETPKNRPISLSGPALPAITRTLRGESGSANLAPGQPGPPVRLGTTPGFLSQVVAPLSAQGWVRSEPGPTGGYRATVSLDDLSVLDVVEAVEGPTDTGRCVLEDRPCGGGGTCALHVAWSRARAQLIEELGKMPLSALPAPCPAGSDA